MHKPKEFPEYFFGYGSLMYADGINRGLRHYYTNDELIPVQLNGFHRSFCVGYDNLTFYGIYEKPFSWINGVIFPLHSLHDYTILLEDEGCFEHPPLYKVQDVTDKVCFVYDYPAESGRVHAVIPYEIDEVCGYMPEYYVRHVWDGIQFWGEPFIGDFLSTGGVRYEDCVFDQEIDNPWNNYKMMGAKRI